ncbi:MAG: hypothetical protein JSV09_09155 [Thermoplasmata archaeon]|nr:MAG: hypothetical protein JSV09_09155 [Thermoplasmata archaeon]
MCVAAFAVVVSTNVSADHIPGKIVVNNDEWTFSETGFLTKPTDTAQFALNVANWFTDGNTGNFLAYSTNFGLTGSTLTSTMTGAGHTWTVSIAIDFSLPNLLQYDAIFLAGNAADNTVLIDYVNAGGNVYLAGGTGWYGPIVEAQMWNTFLNAFGLNFGEYYNLVHVLSGIPVTSAHPIFNNVNYLYYNNGNSVSELDPSNPDTDILEIWNNEGLIGIYAPTYIEVDIDIKPGSDPNSINMGAKGTIPVAILSTEDFDAATVDPLTVALAGAEVKLRGKSDAPQAALEDVNGDGLLDLVVHIIHDGFEPDLGTSEAKLEGETYSGTPIRGSDSVTIVPT